MQIGGIGISQKVRQQASIFLIGTFEKATFFEGTMNQSNPLNNEAGIYIHIPFCKQACHYCNFHFSTSLKYKERMLKSIVQEIDLQASFFDDASIQSIYFGGGTPSLLAGKEIELMVKKIRSTFNVQTDVELTLEANPDDISAAKLSAWMEAGVNRLSLGIQSLDDEVLSWMNRAHKSEEVRHSMELIKAAGIKNYSVDFIFGIPNQAEQYWQNQLEWIVTSEIPHVACYNLTVEEGTALNQRVKTGKAEKVDDALSMKEFVLGNEVLTKAGYEHYEISNFCKPGHMSRHNSAYWKGKGYLGLGPSAHSYYQGVRSWNLANNAKYMDQIERGQLPVEREELSISDQFNEFLMLGLRTQWGISFEDLERFKGLGAVLDRGVFDAWLESGHVVCGGKMYTLSIEGKLIADEISASLFVV